MICRPVLAVALIASMAGGGCATVPHESGRENRQSVHVSTHRHLNPGGTVPVLGWGTGKVAAPEPIVGALCTVSNDRGAWSVTTPGMAEIEPSKRTLRITCKHEGFKDETAELPCVSRRARATMTGASAGLGLASASAAAAAAAPAGFAVAPAAPVVLAAVVVSALVGGGAGYALAGADTYGCQFDIAMTPLP